MCFAVGEDSPYVFSVPSIMGPKEDRNYLGIKILRLFPCFLSNCSVSLRPLHVLTAGS